MKTFKLIPLLLLAVLSACSQPDNSTSPTQNPAGSSLAMSGQVIPTRAGIATFTQVQPAMTTTTSPTSTTTSTPANSPVWSAYHYTCELATGGGTMTMNLAWNDRSNSEEGFRVYRDKQMIAVFKKIHP